MFFCLYCPRKRSSRGERKLILFILLLHPEELYFRVGDIFTPPPSYVGGSVGFFFSKLDRKERSVYCLFLWDISMIYNSGPGWLWAGVPQQKETLTGGR